MVSIDEFINYPNLKKKSLSYTEPIFSINYYGPFPVALLSVFMEKLSSDQGEVIILESVSSKLSPMGLGYIYSSFVLPLIFGDNTIFNDYFKNEFKKSIDSMSTSVMNPSFPKDSLVSEKLNNIDEALLEAKNLNNLKEGDRVIFIRDYLKESVIPGLVAEVVSLGNNVEELVVRPIFESFRVNKLSPRKITVPAAICVPIYYSDNKYLGPPVDVGFYSEKFFEFNKS